MHLGPEAAHEKQEQGSFLKGGVVNIGLVMKNNYSSPLRGLLQNFQSSCGIHEAVLPFSSVVL